MTTMLTTALAWALFVVACGATTFEQYGPAVNGGASTLRFSKRNISVANSSAGTRRVFPRYVMAPARTGA